MRNKWIRLSFGVLILCLLAGCMYPNHLRKENQVTGLEYMVVVQSAIDQYYQDTGVLPIKSFTMDTPIFERYIIDFRKLLNSPYLSSIPPNAYEQGGNHYYMLVNVEEEPTVKLYDLAVAQKVNDIQRAIDQYKLKHNGKAPLDQPYAANWHTIDYGKLGMKAQSVRSVYGGGSLGLLVNESGKVVVDYGQEIAVLIRREAIVPAADVDLRTLLLEHSPYIPVKSEAYYWNNDMPVIQ